MKRTIVFCILTNVAAVCVSGQTEIRTMKKLPDTGQTGDYTKTFGEDSDYSINPMYYSVQNAQVAIDTVTGLMWQRTDGGEMTIENARIYADTVKISGYTDWRLPSAQESFSLMHLDKMNPAMDGTVFSPSGAEYWWTSEQRSNDPGRIWVTNSGGGIGPHLKTETKSAGGTKKIHARVVRNTSSPQPEVHFTDNGDGTVSDHFTGLMWQKMPTADTITWEKALQNAENLSLAGYNDWRLPNIKELNSINDETRNAPSVNTGLFSGVKSGRYWSSTTQKGQTGNAWFIDFQNFGLTSYFAKNKGYYTICVRNYSKSTAVFEQEKFNFSIFPNPTNSVVNIRWENEMVSRIRVYNTSGSIVAEFPSVGLDAQIDLSNLPRGKYVLSFIDQRNCLVGSKLVSRQ